MSSLARGMAFGALFSVPAWLVVLVVAVLVNSVLW